MNSDKDCSIDDAKAAAMEVLLHNLHGPYRGLPRTAGWGYPEPYTRDLMIAGLAALVTQQPKLMAALRRVLETLADSQTSRGHIPSLVHDPEDRGASDTTPLFLLTAAFYRMATGEADFLEEAVNRSRTWMDYQSPSDRTIVAMLPTTDWRDEQWVLGYGLFVNTVVYGYLRAFGDLDKAAMLSDRISSWTVTGLAQHRHVHEGLVVKHTPYYALYSFKVFSSERFDLLGNSLAILTGLAPRTRADKICTWIERECDALRERALLAPDLPPNFFPYIHHGDPDWRERYERFNRPGEYHNGGIWPFICGYYVAALVAAGHPRLAKQKLQALTNLVKLKREQDVEWGFNEWYRAQDGEPSGQDWQTWSAAMYLYAAACVEQGCTPFFDKVREDEHE
jgi:hypothetical protein